MSDHGNEGGVRVRSVLPHLAQPQKGYRYSTDAVILGAFAAQKPTTSWVDLGTGCGVIAFRLAKAWPKSSGVAIERAGNAVPYAQTNLQSEAVSVIRGDIRSFPLRQASFDLAVCNPPFYDANAFRKSLNPDKRVARHALHGDIVEFLRCVRPSLKNGGRFCFVFPAGLVAAKHEAILDLGAFLARRLSFRSFEDSDLQGVCLEYSFEPQEIVEEQLTLFQAKGFYTQKAWDFLRFRLQAP